MVCSRLQNGSSMATDTFHSELSRRRRPFGVTAIATIQILSAVVWGVFTVTGRFDYNVFLGSIGYYEVAGPALAAVGLFISYGMFTLKRQAWVLTMLWAGLNLATSLWTYWEGEPAYLTMLYSVVVVYYLNQREVRAAFMVPLSKGPLRDE
jgi:hypothetical protein